MTNTKDLGTLKVTLEDGSVKAFLLHATVRQGDHVLEVRDAASGGQDVWTIFKFGSAPTKVQLSHRDMVE